MRRARTIILVVLAALVLAVAFAYSSHRRNRPEIYTRCAELRTAFSASDTNAVLALIAPAKAD